MTLIYCAIGLSLFGLLTRVVSPATSLAALLVLSILARATLR